MTKGRDVIPGEHDAKGWFSIMAVKNRYLWLAILGLALTIVQICKFQWCIDLVASSYQDSKPAGVLVFLGMFIFPSIFIRCGIMLITFWNELKGKR